jgi:hypothetical protein
MMSIRRIHLVAAVSAAALASTPIARAASGDSGGLSVRLGAIEGAVRRGDAGALRAAATRDGRVRVDLHGLPGAQGSYGPGQLQVVLRRVFDAFETHAFAFDDERRERAPSMVFAGGTWVRRPRRGGDEVRDTLTFALRLEEGDWRIVEIRSSP